VAEVVEVDWFLGCFASWCYLMLDRLFEELAEGMLFMGLMRGKLFVELANDVVGWLWCNGKIMKVA
jgi:hypothetical protein